MDKDFINRFYEELEDRFKDTTDIRQDLISKLEKEVKKIEFDFDTDSSKLIEAKLAVINSLNNMLTSDESNITNKVKLMLSKKSSDNEEKTAEIVTNVLKNIQLNTDPLKSVQAPELLAKAFAITGQTITDGELEF